MTAPGTINAQYPALFQSRAIAVNQFGYDATAPKHAVLALGDGPSFGEVSVHDAATGAVVLRANPDAPLPVANWGQQRYQLVDFTTLARSGSYYLDATDASGGVTRSPTFRIAPTLSPDLLPAALLGYFNSQRASGRYKTADRAIRFIGNKRAGTVDVHGGWFDASGDVSKYLSHLSYTNHMNPQQTPLVVWALCQAAETPHGDDRLIEGFRDEALYGADFLVRMCDPDGMFYMTVFDRWSGDPAQREICSYSTQAGHKHDTWEAGMRQGGGMAIAALARVARLGAAGEYAPETYLSTATRAFEHLQTNNSRYLDDGQENIIDDYCGLLAATELTLTTGEARFRQAAASRAASLLGRLSSGFGHDGWWRADNGTRPFFHASDEGLPMAALTEYLAIAPEAGRPAILSALVRAAAHISNVTAEVANPFGYPRQLVRQSYGGIGTQFFFPHVNESGYWWQGENARLASLASALRRVAPHLEAGAAITARRTAQRCIDWILGLNPYHCCMMQGFGGNWAVYGPAKFPNVDGGICNGITSALQDEAGITFCETEDTYQSWRWSEQWLPHAAWFLLALTKD